ncbi:MAG: DUF2817 domain-containing protein [Candidatus Thermoplasmatota archaeon]|nr:DUF2817 domain-containing protein [Candidatus Thermoplasmatota archaeon]
MPSDARLKRLFAKEYVSARQNFLDICEKMELNIESRSIPEKGPHEEELTTDFVWFGPEDAGNLILHSSGVHGVEGYPGSAAQVWILEGLHTGEISLPDNTAFASIHIVNPWGMAWLRRVNEDNADLNRNFLPPDEEYTGEPEHYAKLDAFLNPTVPQKGFEFYTLKALWYSARLGFATAKQTVQEGQYNRPKALQFGGSKLANSSQHVIDWLSENLSDVKKVIWFDFHTGLGPFGVDSLLVSETADKEMLKENYGDRIQVLDPKKSVAYRIRGGIQSGVEIRFPDIKWTSITQEFGTIKPIPLLRLARAENRLTQWSGKPQMALLRSKERQAMLNGFSPPSNKWRRMILNRSRAIVKDAITELTKN